MLLLVALVALLASVRGAQQLDKQSLLACRLSQPSNHCEAVSASASSGDKVCRDNDDLPRIVAIGDIHGSLEGLLEDLFYANLTVSKTRCEWRPQTERTLVVQMGDYVDRGAGALESLQCVRDLQAKAKKFNAEVVRLVGNHELWWLEGYFHDRNKAADTRAKVEASIQILVEDILSGRMVAAHVLRHRNDVPLMFVHAGYQPAFLQYLHNTVSLENTAEAVAEYTNRVLRETTGRCRQFPCAQYTDEVFEAGPDRGGKGVGGPFWTDFGTIETAVVRGKTKQQNFIQVVGHTMAYCYDRRRPNVHPPVTQAECSLGLVRATADLSSVCVDGGMFLGARAFLEIGRDGHLRSFERRGAEGVAPWKAKDFTAAFCANDAQKQTL